VLPSNNAQEYLQAHYTVLGGDTSPTSADAGDGSAWSAANAHFNDYFHEIATRFEYDDALVLDTRGNVVYSLKKVFRSARTFSAVPIANPTCAGHTRRQWRPTPWILCGSPTFGTTSPNLARP
jgi:hypothetical protein